MQGLGPRKSSVKCVREALAHTHIYTRQEKISSVSNHMGKKSDGGEIIGTR